MDKNGYFYKIVNYTLIITFQKPPQPSYLLKNNVKLSKNSLRIF